MQRKREGEDRWKTREGRKLENKQVRWEKERRKIKKIRVDEGKRESEATVGRRRWVDRKGRGSGKEGERQGDLKEVGDEWTRGGGERKKIKVRLDGEEKKKRTKSGKGMARGR